ncbi:MAG TPA: hypothetical protein VFZ37_12065 [Jiangellaceae bacterium]
MCEKFIRVVEELGYHMRLLLPTDIMTFPRDLRSSQLAAPFRSRSAR